MRPSNRISSARTRGCACSRNSSAGSRIRPTSALNNTGMALYNETLTSDEQSTGQEIQMRRTFALAVLAIMAVAGNAFAIGEARMQGKITDAATHKPIPNAVIVIDAQTGHKVHNEFKADKDGAYRFLIL